MLKGLCKKYLKLLSLRQKSLAGQQDFFIAIDTCCI